MAAPSTLLRIDESVDLGHAWVQSIADQNDVRIIFIKGPSLYHHGLREQRLSADVDVLVEPARFDDLCRVLNGLGWKSRPSLFIDEINATHSVTFIHDQWPCDIDLHHRFPGFLATPDEVFEALWERRERMQLAHQWCQVQDRISGILLLALHSIRGAQSQPRHSQELAHLLSIPLSPRERASIADLAVRTGSAATLAHVLSDLKIAVDAAETISDPLMLRAWRERIDAGSEGAYPWLLALRKAPWRARPGIVWRSLWPSRQDLLVANPSTSDTASGRAEARLSRLHRGARSLPAAIRAILRNRSS